MLARLKESAPWSCLLTLPCPSFVFSQPSTFAFADSLLFVGLRSWTVDARDPRAVVFRHQQLRQFDAVPETFDICLRVQLAVQLLGLGHLAERILECLTSPLSLL